MNELIQGSTEWLEARKSFITSTDAAVILGLSPWKTPYKLWRQKMDLDPPEQENEAMRQGTRLEPLAREWCEDYLMKKFNPKVIFKDFMMASLDGISSDERDIIEIKCGAKSLAQAKEGRIPQYYYCQIQHQLYVSDFKFALYVCFDGQEGIIIPVKINYEFIEEMIEKEKEFYQCLISFTPPAMTSKDYHQRSDSEWEELSGKYRDAYLELKRVEQREKHLKQQLIALAGSQSSQGIGIKLSKVTRKGNIDYSKIPQLEGVNLESYRKPPSEYWKIQCDEFD